MTLLSWREKRRSPRVAVTASVTALVASFVALLGCAPVVSSGTLFIAFLVNIPLAGDAGSPLRFGVAVRRDRHRDGHRRGRSVSRKIPVPMLVKTIVEVKSAAGGGVVSKRLR